MRRSEYRIVVLLLVLTIGWLSQCDGQTRRGFRGSGRPGGGASIGLGGRTRPSVSNNPVANPTPSLTPHEVFHPPGALSAGQVLNPYPSLDRPRSGGTTPGKIGPVLSSESVRVFVSPHALSPEEPFTRIIESARVLSNELDKFASGPQWKKYLFVDQLLLSTSSLTEPESVVGVDLEAVLSIYNKVSSSPDYQSVSELDGFREVHAVVQSATMSEARRELAELVRLNLELQSALERFEHAQRWREYLAIPIKTNGPIASTPSLVKLQQVKVRFDGISRVDKYQSLTRLSIFEQTNAQLSRYLACLRAATQQ